MLDAGRDHLTPGLRFPENFAYFSGRGIGGKVPVMDLFPPQHIPHRAAHQTNFPVPGPEKRGNFSEYRVNSQKNSSVPPRSVYRRFHTKNTKEEKDTKGNKRGLLCVLCTFVIFV